jgi:hypothetical protein
MLNYPNLENFFLNCLEQCGLVDSYYQTTTPTLAQLKADPKLQAAMVRSLNDIKSGADAMYESGKPADSITPYEEWERRWSAWTASRTAAFYSRAALMLLGDKSYFPYFIEILRDSQNLAFLSSSNDLLQHYSGYYLSGPEEDLTSSKLAGFWEKRGC